MGRTRIHSHGTCLHTTVHIEALTVGRREGALARFEAMSPHPVHIEVGSSGAPGEPIVRVVWEASVDPAAIVEERKAAGCTVGIPPGGVHDYGGGESTQLQQRCHLVTQSPPPPLTTTENITSPQ